MYAAAIAFAVPAAALAAGGAGWPGDGILDGEAHVGMTELG